MGFYEVTVDVRKNHALGTVDIAKFLVHTNNRYVASGLWPESVVVVVGVT